MLRMSNIAGTSDLRTVETVVLDDSSTDEAPERPDEDGAVGGAGPLVYGAGECAMGAGPLLTEVWSMATDKTETKAGTKDKVKRKRRSKFYYRYLTKYQRREKLRKREEKKQQDNFLCVFGDLGERGNEIYRQHQIEIQREKELDLLRKRDLKIMRERDKRRKKETSTQTYDRFKDENKKIRKQMEKELQNKKKEENRLRREKLRELKRQKEIELERKREKEEYEAALRREIMLHQQEDWKVRMDRDIQRIRETVNEDSESSKGANVSDCDSDLVLVNDTIVIEDDEPKYLKTVNIDRLVQAKAPASTNKTYTIDKESIEHQINKQETTRPLPVAFFTNVGNDNGNLCDTDTNFVMIPVNNQSLLLNSAFDNQINRQNCSLPNGDQLLIPNNVMVPLPGSNSVICNGNIVNLQVNNQLLSLNSAFDNNQIDRQINSGLLNGGSFILQDNAVSLSGSNSGMCNGNMVNLQESVIVRLVEREPSIVYCNPNSVKSDVITQNNVSKSTVRKDFLRNYRVISSSSTKNIVNNKSEVNHGNSIKYKENYILDNEIKLENNTENPTRIPILTGTITQTSNEVVKNIKSVTNKTKSVPYETESVTNETVKSVSNQITVNDNEYISQYVKRMNIPNVTINESPMPYQTISTGSQKVDVTKVGGEVTVTTDRVVDWEDQIPMDVIAVVEKPILGV